MVPKPAKGEVQVRITAIGVNFIDTYQRAGLYKIPLPTVLGVEGAGTIEAVGEGVTAFKPGDTVAWSMARGSYAEYQAVPASMLVRVPAGVTPKQAAAAMLATPSA